MKKWLAISLAAVFCLTLFSGCGQTQKNTLAENKAVYGVYTYAGTPFSELASDRFTITLFADGTFTYSESLLSSYFGAGEWSAEGDVLTLSDQSDGAARRVNHFLMEEKDLVYLAEGSDNFIYIKVQNGERFTDIAS